ncbi:MAG: cell wall-binding repeat-containing protein [Clostridium sp.]|jgi:putative cell wall-binding protein|uniref:cell wall-binding repeat-containing protein n=2 Tax=Clostridium sp. TaxID=1506 RepID=UPI0025C0882A|nr:cell wall-binding repeat-containing protein [Clostridium sp.]MCH3963694.1 cell wall-binding repeat-containing protein [Clostridium sp.]MCI1714835.1 cell wall-binding repeat-containing protein [Clostridium sp.]MCI1798976.1 cell wall-binding repeat-containing protein [Clostridium sp.]MCI1813018.1 cell wall-binding repeat-containing protein [Clostridium sp.]MCI1869908.1 cell wall-binding repeat-containing protein [Clostridium sp.]
MKSKKLLPFVLSASVIAAALGSVSYPWKVKAAEGSVTRAGGINRYETAANAAKSNWPNGSDYAVVVNGTKYADAVSASTLAKKLDAPILLTEGDELDSNAKAALKTLKTKSVYIVGGEGVISKSVENSLSGYKVKRLQGKDRYGTNLAVARELVEKGVSKDNILVVAGGSFSDALSAAPVAAAKDEILLLSSNYKASIKDSIDFAKGSNVTVIGTTYSISDDVKNAFSPAAKRIDGGEDRFSTNLKVLNAFKDDLNGGRLYISSASRNAADNQFADALVASVLAGKYNSPLLLVDREGLKSTNNAVEYIKNNADKTTDLQIVGGTGAVPASIECAINDAASAEKSGNSDNSNNSNGNNSTGDDNDSSTSQTQTFTGYITTEDDFAAELGEDTADMVYMKLMALSGLGITFKENGNWVFYYFDGDIATNNTKGEGGKWTFDGTGSQLKAWKLVENQVKNGEGEKPVPVTVKGTLDGSTRTNPGPDADGELFKVIKVKSLTADSGSSGTENPQLSGIAVSSPADKLEYEVGEELDITGLKVKGTYEDGSTKDETITEANITGFDSSKAVEGQVLTITVDGKTTSYKVSIKDKVPQEQTFTGYIIDQHCFNSDSNPGNDTKSCLKMKSCAASGYGIGVPQNDGTYKFHYFDGEFAPNATGTQVKAYELIDKSSKNSHISITVTGELNGDVKVVDGVSYPVITVSSLAEGPEPDPSESSNLSSIAVSSPADKLEYEVGEKLDITGLKVKGTYEDGSTKDETITEANITGFDSSKEVEGQVLTITVDGRTTSYKVDIKDKAPQVQTFTGYITTEDDYAAELNEDTAFMVYMKMMALSGLGITYQDEDGKWVFYYLDGNIATNNTKGNEGSWIFDGTGSQLDAWNIVEEQVKRNSGVDKMKPVPVTVTGILDGSTQTNPGLDADGKYFEVIKAQSIAAD